MTDSTGAAEPASPETWLETSGWHRRITPIRAMAGTGSGFTDPARYRSDLGERRSNAPFWHAFDMAARYRPPVSTALPPSTPIYDRGANSYAAGVPAGGVNQYSSRPANHGTQEPADRRHSPCTRSGMALRARSGSRPVDVGAVLDGCDDDLPGVVVDAGDDPVVAGAGAAHSLKAGPERLAGPARKAASARLGLRVILRGSR